MNVTNFYNYLWSSSTGKELHLQLWEEALEHSYRLLQPIAGKRILEIGCGAGDQAIELAKMEAIVTAIDIAEASVALTLKRTAEENVSVTVLVMEAEKLEFRDNQFDAVYINSTLMHMNQEKVLRECARVIKPGGSAVVVEPLKYHPLLMVYRLFSPYRKTRPKYMTSVRFTQLGKLFRTMEQQEFYWLSVPVLGWKNSKVKKMVMAADRFLAKHVPGVKHLCWVGVGKYVK